MRELFNILTTRVRALWQRERVLHDIEEEQRIHIEMEIEALIRSGMQPDEARRIALRSFGKPDRNIDLGYDVRGGGSLETVVQDIRYGFRVLLKQPGFTLVAVLSLALGIGANTAIFTVLDSLLLKALPVREPHQLVQFGTGDAKGVTGDFPHQSMELFAHPFYKEVREHNQMFSSVAALLSITWTVHGSIDSRGAGSSLERMEVQPVSGSYFSMLGVNAALGRTFTDADDQIPEGHPLVVISHAWWESHLAADPSAVGKSITIDKTSYTIIGVTPKEFFGTMVGKRPDLWVPLAMEKRLPPFHWDYQSRKDFQSLYIMGRLKNGVSIEQANAAINLLFKQYLHDWVGAQPTAEKVQEIQRASIDLVSAEKGLSNLRRDFSLSLRVLMAVVALVLLIACANIANLSLARASNRQKEFALRLALGAARARLVRQLLTESLLLASLGGVAGVALAWWGSRLLVLMASTGANPLPLDVRPDLRTLFFTLIVSVLSAVIFGTAPALRAARVEPNVALKGGTNSAQSVAPRRLGKVLIIAQVSLSLLLLVGAGLFVRTLINLQNVPTGFSVENVMLFTVDSASPGHKADQLSGLMREVEERVQAVPGVESASFSFFVFNQGQATSAISTREPHVVDENSQNARTNIVGTDFFATMGLPIVEGRNFGPQDSAKSQRVAVISEAMAARFFPRGSLGRRFGTGGPETSEQIEVIGVVKDARYRRLDEQIRPMAYFVHAQRSQPLNNFVVRFSGKPDAVIPQVRQAIRQVNSSLPVDEVISVSDHIGRSLVQQKLIARLASFFALLALMLACVGLYGVLSYAVVRRTNEIGIRVALGAQRRKVEWLILREALALAMIGVGVGLVAAILATRVTSQLLFGLKPTDPLSFVAATLVLLAVATVAGYVPARRAARIDPLIALRRE